LGLLGDSHSWNFRGVHSDSLLRMVQEEGKRMNYLRIALGVILLLFAIALTIGSEGLLLPFALPIGLFGLMLAGVKTQ